MKLSLDKLRNLAGSFLVCCLCISFVGADSEGCSSPPPVSSSGVNKADVKVPVDPTDHLTMEQRNVRDRLILDNKPGATKYLYVISAYTGEVLIYSTVRGKVTSGGKRLTPNTVAVANYQGNGGPGFSVPDLGGLQVTAEVLQDDGTYGSSGEYIFWWDTNGNYHQLGTAGALWQVSDKPIAIRHTTLNLDLQGEVPTSSGNGGGGSETGHDPAPTLVPNRNKK